MKKKQLYSDRLRIAKIAILSLILLGFCIYSYVEGNKRTDQYLDNLSGGDVARLSYWKVVDKQKDYMKITNGRRFLDIHMDTDGIQKGDKISLTAVKRGKDLYLQKFHVHTAMRNLKIWVSVLPLLIVFFLFLRRYRFDTSKCVFTRRRSDD